MSPITLFKYPVKAARKALTPYHRKSFVSYSGYVEYADEEANGLIRAEMSQDKPLMIGKLGTVEMGCIRNYLSMQEPKRVKDIFNYIRRQKKFLWWWDMQNPMSNNAGFFPPTGPMLERFCKLLLEDVRELDVLCSYIKEESLIKNQLSQARKINIRGLSTPFRFQNPWTETLKGKKVLVVHPFEESIRRQYQKHTLLFDDPRVLPEFELITLKAVQTIAGNRSQEFKNWFDALQYMKDKISNTNFDIALIGCGAYGLPLAAHVKRLGKKGIHMASSTQILFGIYGKRWETWEGYKKIINEHWVRPLPSETPPNHKAVERGAYW